VTFRSVVTRFARAGSSVRASAVIGTLTKLMTVADAARLRPAVIPAAAIAHTPRLLKLPMIRFLLCC